MIDTAILIINWNNGPDTIACLQSVLQMDDARIYLLDNASTDGSYAEIDAFLKSIGRPYVSTDLGQAERLQVYNEKLVFIRAPENLGFARGNNELLRLVMKKADIRYSWLLNNDAVAAPDALVALKQAMNSDPGIAFAGSATLDHDKPFLVQCCGVRYYKYFGVGKLQFKNRRWDSLDRREVAANPADFQNGASLLVRMDALQRIGLMDERFFLYSEEHDWQHRAGKLGYRNVLAADSIIYHKGSVSTSSAKHRFYYYYNRSSVFFSRKHYSLIINIVASVMLIGITLVRTRLNGKSLSWGLKGIWEGWRKSLT